MRTIVMRPQPWRVEGFPYKRFIDKLFGNTPGQAEKLLSDSPHVNKIKVVSMYLWDLAPSNATALIGEEDASGTGIVVARRAVVPAFLRSLNVNPDIVFMVSNSPTNRRASAYGTTDNDARGGDAFTYDGRRLFHRYFHTIPGMAAMHTTSEALTAAHEFGHAFSSYTNGFITDLYVDGGTEFNRKMTHSRRKRRRRSSACGNSARSCSADRQRPYQ